MKKLIVVFLVLFGYGGEFDIYSQYVKRLVNYEAKLTQKIYNPFPVIKKPKTSIPRTRKRVKKVTKKVVKKVFRKKSRGLKLLSVFNNRAFVKLEGTNIKKWLGIGDIIDGYKLVKLIDDKTILVAKDNKNKVVTINSSNFSIKVR